MSHIKLENVLALNEELAALAEVGIPWNLTPGAAQRELPDQLRLINHSLTTRLQLGQSLLDATAESQELPSIYRSALEVGLRSKRLTATLDGLSRQADTDGELRSTIGRSLVAPLIVSLLAYFGFILLCLYYSPTVEAMYAQVGAAPGSFTIFLITLREWMPYWASLVPLLFLVTVLFWRSKSRRNRRGIWQRFVPGARRYAANAQNANFAQQLTTLIENGVSLADSLPLAAAVTGDAGLITASQALSAAHVKEENLAADAEVLQALPPLLRWALTGDLGDQSLPEILRFAEKTYRQKAENRAALWRLLLPAILSSVLGGIIVLAYGLSLFGPFVQLLQDLAP